YVNKALDIDPENEQYWKRYAGINLVLNNYEDAYEGYRKSVVFGNMDLAVFLSFSDMNIVYEKPEQAIEILIQASEVYPENSEIDYRLAGLYLTKEDFVRGVFHLSNALVTDFDSYSV